MPKPLVVVHVRTLPCNRKTGGSGIACTMVRAEPVVCWRTTPGGPLESEHLTHTIPPTFDCCSRVLVLGSFPSPKSREYGFNYGHPQNRFWRVLASLADEDVPMTVDERKDFCLRHGIALWDVVGECDIVGASDTSIRNARPNDLSLITRSAPIEAVFCTGSKAHELYRRLGCEQMCGMAAVRLPSTSPANAACGMDRLVEAYRQVFEHLT